MTEFEKLFLENREFIFKYLMKLTQNPSLAEELTQETFFRAYMNYASLRNKNTAAPWLCQIARNAYFAWYNEHKRHLTMEHAESVCVAVSMEEALIQQELSQNAMQCLQVLEEPYREVFMLFVLGGLSHKQISSLFGKSESWARVTFYRAKQKLLEGLR